MNAENHVARAQRLPGPGESLASWIVLGLLAALALWVGVRQSSFNPAVTAALNAPAGGGAARASDLAVLLPPAGEGLTPSGAPEFFGADTLADKINGKAELYLPAGFRELACQRLSLAGRPGHLELFLYDMAAPANAFAVFSAQRRPGFARMELGDHAYLAGNALFFAQGPFYAEIIADSAVPGTAEALERLARLLAARLPRTRTGAGDPGGSGGEPAGSSSPGAALAETALFPAEGLKPDTVRLMASDAFGMQGLSGVYSGEYRLPAGEATAFLARRSSPAEAREQASGFARFILDNGGAELRPPEGLPEGARMLDALGDFELVFASGPWLAGVHGAANPAVALELGRAVAASLAGPGGGR